MSIETFRVKINSSKPLGKLIFDTNAIYALTTDFSDGQGKPLRLWDAAALPIQCGFKNIVPAMVVHEACGVSGIYKAAAKIFRRSERPLCATINELLLNTCTMEMMGPRHLDKSDSAKFMRGLGNILADYRISADEKARRIKCLQQSDRKNFGDEAAEQLARHMHSNEPLYYVSNDKQALRNFVNAKGKNHTFGLTVADYISVLYEHKILSAIGINAASLTHIFEHVEETQRKNGLPIVLSGLNPKKYPTQEGIKAFDDALASAVKVRRVPNDKWSANPPPVTADARKRLVGARVGAKDFA